MSSSGLTIDTQRLFERSFQQELSGEGARECIANLFGFIELLSEWEASAAGPGDQSGNTPTRFAIYTRTASDVSGGSRVIEQAKTCISRISVMQPEWVLADGCIEMDDCAAGLNCDQLPGLAALIEKSQRQPKPFDYVVMSSMDRLGGDVHNVARIVEILRQAGVAIYALP